MNSEAQKPLAPFRGERGTELDCFPGDTLGLPIPATAKALRARFGDDEFIQLTGAIGYYSLLCMTVNACELEAGQGAEVLQV